ncbi:MAG: glycyl-radical enzyme activating protein [Ruminococcaceae bacterium]|nr:glycyl-radical enzyme activating protein [Oscillospiraceae bacterium]
MNGKIFDIQKFCTSDGPGIRTTVFFKGCPLHCLWCHNPESQSSERQVMFYADKCRGCGRCKDADDSFVCYNDARRVCGRTVTVDEVITEVLRDKVFYETSGGGVTLSGGEPLYQADFALEILKRARENGIHTAIETCGFAPKDRVGQIAEYTDLFLFDVKETDAQLHQSFTGVDNVIILENLRLIDSLGKDIILRCPIVPECNARAEHYRGIAELANSLASVKGIEIEPYHSLGEGKNVALGNESRVFRTLTAEEIEDILATVRKYTDVPVSRS